MKKRNLLSLQIVLLCAVLMLGMLAGCSSKTTTPPESSSPSETTSPAEPDPDIADNDTSDVAPVETTDTEFVASATPFANELQNLSVWCTSGFLNAQMDINNGNDNLAIQELEKRTNVHIDWTHAPDAGATEAFNLMLASEEYDDIIIQAGASYSQGLDYYVDEEILIDLVPYLDTFASDYRDVITSDEDVRRAVTTDAGRVPMFYTVNYNVQPTFFGYVTNQAWLDEAGITELPDTVEEFGHMLEVFTANGYGSNATMYLYNNGFDSIFLSAYDTGSGFLNIDGTSVYGPTTENYKNYLATISDWYAKGYIDVDFMSRIHNYVDVNLFMSAEVAVYPLMKAHMSLVDSTWATIDEKWTTVALPTPRAVEGTPTIASVGCIVSRVSAQGMAVTTACQNPELATRWCNYFFSPEGSILADYGIEGLSFNYVDGEPVLSELIWNNEEYAMTQQLSVYCIPENVVPRLYAWERYDTPDTPEKVARTDEVWFNNFDLEHWIGIPDGVAMTAEENETYANRMNDITTYMQEYTLSVITGVEDLNSSWDEYVAHCEQMGLSNCTALQQAALDRYFSK